MLVCTAAALLQAGETRDPRAQHVVTSPAVITLVLLVASVGKGGCVAPVSVTAGFFSSGTAHGKEGVEITVGSCLFLSSV